MAEFWILLNVIMNLHLLLIYICYVRASVQLLNFSSC